MQCYDVALWRWWPSLMPDVVEVVQAFSPRSALFDVMERAGLRFVERAAVVEVVAVACPGSAGIDCQQWCGVESIQRWDGVLCPKREEVMPDE